MDFNLFPSLFCGSNRPGFGQWDSPPPAPTKLPLDYINTPPSFSKQCFKKCVLSSSFLAPGLESSTSSKSPGFFQWGECLNLPIWVFGVVTGNLKYTQARTWG